MKSTLTELVAAAAGGSTENSPLPLDLAAALYTAVAEDRASMRLNGAPATAQMMVEISSTDDPDEYLATAESSLRYSLTLDGEAAVTRLCWTLDCWGESVGRGMLTRPCRDHLDNVVPGLLPNAADDIRPGDREAAARESRTMRLNAWEQEARNALIGHQGDLRVIDGLRTESA
ncbi:hypothetical protein K388_07096 [Streptomyces sp. KhCrAH-43]|uniref:hypothetical protein n=1 Tax=unclassified Streptomyces TaxID=2593676 RepID=UPI000DC5B58A|nr:MULTISPECIES: hypothetical protein [unclassified Streptomyces]RAJ47859.1 hypothetical protein K388_07096 [Streptomyces sp. KhCrAH-43]